MVALPDMWVDAAIAEYAQDSWNSRSRPPPLESVDRQETMRRNPC